MNKASFLGITILVTAAALIGYFVYAVPEEKPWNGLSCEEMFDFAMSPEHNSLTEQQHIQFHKDYEPCIQKMDKSHT